jgi:Domain of unknown function (DUF222)/HNH endonuclease
MIEHMFDHDRPSSLSTRVLEQMAEVERARAELIGLVGEWDAAEEWKADGALSAASWLAHRGPTTRADALRVVQTARHARTHERTAKVLEAGDVSVPHVEMMAMAAFQREEVFAREEDELIELAAAQRPEQFRVTMCQWRNRADEQLANSDGFNASERCYLRGKPRLGSLVKVDGLFEADGWATILAALRPFERPDAVPSMSPRSGGRRLADALVELAAQSPGGKAGGGRVRFAADIVIDYETLMRIANRDLLSRICDIEGLGPIPLAMAERLLCDCAVGRVLMRGQSEVLDLGRRTEVVSRAQRRALARRDKHCRFPGCDRPVRWSDAHHLMHWIRGGPTDLDNLVLLCRRHHKACHEGGWDLVRNIDGSFSAERASGRAPPWRVAA